jgi:hypothetical protein
MKIALNRDFGGFGLSKAAYEALGIPWDGYGYAYRDDDQRTDPRLIEVIERLGSRAASGPLAKLKIIEIPDDVDFIIDDYDGLETIHERHRSWPDE